MDGHSLGITYFIAMQGVHNLGGDISALLAYMGAGAYPVVATVFFSGKKRA